MLLVKGQKVKISDLTSSSVLGINITLKLTGPGHIRHVCVGLDPNRLLGDKRFFIYDQAPNSPAGAVRLLGPGLGETADYQVSLGALPGSVPRLVFASAIYGPGAFNQLAYGHLRLSQGGQELARLVVTGHDFTYEKSLILGQLYLHQGVWRLSADVQGFVTGAEGLLEHLGAAEVLSAIAPKPPERLIIVIPAVEGDFDDAEELEEILDFEDDAWPEEDQAHGEDPVPAPAKPRIIH
ncbi:MAG: tellurium resistance TerZ family protein [Deltaproteobacteria bacterium]|jgi:stress response protein SCP2|nr:tellurium resistance TerZ family protein [Deltaproteobacteria bacterium]